MKVNHDGVSHGGVLLAWWHLCAELWEMWRKTAFMCHSSHKWVSCEMSHLLMSLVPSAQNQESLESLCVTVFAGTGIETQLQGSQNFEERHL